VVSCPFGVVERNNDDGRAFKCTFCYDRQKDGLVPACAKASDGVNQVWEIGELQARAEDRVQELQGRGMRDATLYDAADSSVGGTHAMFILRGDPRSYNLPPQPEVPTVYLKRAWTSSALAAGLLLAGSVLAFLALPEKD
jgi:formate dehydrogenase iron-sulfur subunit